MVKCVCVCVYTNTHMRMCVYFYSMPDTVLAQDSVKSDPPSVVFPNLPLDHIHAHSLTNLPLLLLPNAGVSLPNELFVEAIYFTIHVSENHEACIK